MTLTITDRRAAHADFADPVGPARPEKDTFREIATVAKDVTISVYGGVMQPNDDTLATRGSAEGYKIYDQIERDCHAYAVLGKRKRAVTSREWQLIPGGETPRDEECAEFIRETLKRLLFDRMCENLLDATMKGFSVGEILWVRDGARIVPAAVKPRDQRRFLFDEQGDLRLKTLSSLMPGEELPSRKFIVHRFESKDDNPYGLGMGTRLFWPVWFKRQNIKFWLTFADRCGSPTVVGTYPAGTSLPDQAKLKAACMAISHEAGVTLPEGLAIKYLEAQIHGSINTYERLCDYMDGEISKAVLGETGTTDQQGSGGSRARDEVGDKIRLEITKADADMLCQTLNSTLITWTTEFNFPGLVPPQVWRIFGDDEDLKDRADRDKTLKETGVRFTKQYFIKAYSFEEDDIEVVDSPAPVPAPGMTGPAFAEGAALADPVMLEQAGDAIARGYQALLGRRVEDLLALLEETRDLETFRARLADLLAAPPSPAMVESLARAGFAARLQGRLTAEQMQGRLQRMKERRGE